jgi:hypothetical protein
MLELEDVVFLHGLDPGSNPGEAQIEEIVKFLAKTGRPRGSSPRPSDSRPVLGYLYPSGWVVSPALDFPSYVCHI